MLFLVAKIINTTTRSIYTLRRFSTASSERHNKFDYYAEYRPTNDLKKQYLIYIYFAVVWSLIYVRSNHDGPETFLSLSVTFWANRFNSHDNDMDRSRITPYSAGSTLDVRI